MKSGVARKNIKDIEIYKDQLTNRLDPTMSLMQGINAKVRKNPKRVIFAEGEDENMLKASIEFGRNKLGTPILIGAEKRIKEQIAIKLFEKLIFNFSFQFVILSLSNF